MSTWWYLLNYTILLYGVMLGVNFNYLATWQGWVGMFLVIGAMISQEELGKWEQRNGD
jgi:hypothetical protein